MGDTTFNVLDSAAATVTFRAQAVVGTTLVMMSVPSDPAGTAIIGQKAMASSISVAIANNQSNVPFNLVSFNGTTLTIGQQVVTASIPVVLPSNQIVSTNLAQVGGVAVALGQAIMATSIPVAIASNQSAIPVTGAGGTSTVTLAGGTALVTLAGGTGLVTLTGGTASVTLAGGTASVNLNQINGTTISIGQQVMTASFPVVFASNQSNLPTNLAQIGGSTLAFGQAVMATSIPVAIASNQSPIPVTGSFTISTADVNLIKVGGTTISIGQAVMATSLPVAIASNQSAIPVTGAGGTSTVTLAGGTASVDLNKINGTTINIGQGVMTASFPVVIASNQSNLPTNLLQIGGSTLGFGQAVMATSLPVAIASNQSAIPVTGAGGTSTVTLAGGTALVTLAGGTALLAGGTASVTLAGGTSALQLTGYTSFPTAVANAALATAISDKAGRIIAVSSARDWRSSQTAAITTGAEITVINPVNATTFADVYGVILANTGNTTCKVDFRHGTGSTIVFSIQSYSSDTRGFMLPADAAIVGSITTSNVSWTAQPSATAAINVSMFYVKNI